MFVGLSETENKDTEAQVFKYWLLSYTAYLNIQSSDNRSMVLAILAHLVEKVEHAVSLQLTLPRPMEHSLGTARKYSDTRFACDDWIKSLKTIWTPAFPVSCMLS